MDAFYLEIRTLHITAVLCSGALFLLRAFAHNLLDAAWPMSRVARRLAYAIDTTLLAAALMLIIIVGQYPFVDSWLTVKVLLLVAYILLGWQALRAPGRARRILFMLAAAATYAFIVSVARAHDPLGILSSGRLW